MLDNLMLNIVSVNAIQVSCDDRIKEMFWEYIDSMIMDISDFEEIYFGGNINGHRYGTNERGL